MKPKYAIPDAAKVPEANGEGETEGADEDDHGRAGKLARFQELLEKQKELSEKVERALSQAIAMVDELVADRGASEDETRAEAIPWDQSPRILKVVWGKDYCKITRVHKHPGHGHTSIARPRSSASRETQTKLLQLQADHQRRQ
jgi:hypothetical protein